MHTENNQRVCVCECMLEREREKEKPLETQCHYSVCHEFETQEENFPTGRGTALGGTTPQDMTRAGGDGVVSMVTTQPCCSRVVFGACH